MSHIGDKRKATSMQQREMEGHRRMPATQGWRRAVPVIGGRPLMCAGNRWLAPPAHSGDRRMSRDGCGLQVEGHWHMLMTGRRPPRHAGDRRQATSMCMHLAEDPQCVLPTGGRPPAHSSDHLHVPVIDGRPLVGAGDMWHSTCTCSQQMEGLQCTPVMGGHLTAHASNRATAHADDRQKTTGMYR